MSIFWILYFGYLWPSLKGNGPEAIAQTILYGLIALAVYPPLRVIAKREAEHLHAKMDHIIKHHPDIPSFDDQKHGFEPKDGHA
jgi:hypothetical protein